MRSIEIVDSLIEALDANSGATTGVAAAVLVIVIETSGSAPRGPGAWMAVHADGRIEGTVGGGALEARVVEDARALLEIAESKLVRYTIGGVGSDTGMVCGGSVELLLMSLDTSFLDPLKRMAGLISERREGVCAIDLAPFGGGLPPEDHGETRARTAKGAVPWTVVPAEAALAEGAGLPVAPCLRGDRYLEPIRPEGRALVFGCGHVGRAVVEVLGFAGFEVVACDDRPEMLGRELLPRAAERLRVDYGDLSTSLVMGRRDFAIVCTSGHVSDFEVLVQALRARPAYIGCLGSKRKTAGVRARLMGEGFSAEEVDAIHMPVGVPIACETPEEIAISIAAQMVDARRSM